MERNRAQGFAAAALAAALLLGAASARATNTAGTLDPTWSVGAYGAGFAVFSPGNSRVHPRGVKMLPDQRMIVSTDPVTLGRLGTTGIASLPFGFLGGTVISGGCSSSQWPTGIAIQPDGKILTACTNGSNDVLVARFTASNGAVDTTFGTAASGVVTTDVSARSNYGNGLALTPDGKIVVAGLAYNSTITASDVTVMRYTSAGALDPAFGSGGIVVTSLPSTWLRAGPVIVQGDGKIVVGGSSGAVATVANPSPVNIWLLARYNTDGTLDTTFGSAGTGMVTLDWAQGGGTVRAMALQGDGRIVIAGNFLLSSGAGAQAIGLARYNTDGTLDTSFGGGVSNTMGPGTRWTSIDLGELPLGLALQYDGKIVVAGQTTTGVFSKVNALVLRYTADGSLDTTFGTGGYISQSTNANNFTDIAYGVDVQADGKLVVALDGGLDGLVMRLLGDTPEVLTLSFAGTGTGQVTSTPGGINCTVNCTGNFALGLPLTLTATATNGGQFTGWTGCDSVNGSNQCVVSINGARGVTAQFDSLGSAAATVGIASSANPSISGQSVTFTATVSGSSGTPTGTVTFNDNGTAIPGCSALALASGAAQCVASALATGTHPITVAYSGDATYGTATSSTISQSVTVPKANPTVALAASANPLVLGQGVTFTALVSGSAGTATGTLEFDDGGVAIAGCASVPLAAGSASCGPVALAAGSHTVTATYSGDSAYDGATSSAVNELVIAPPAAPAIGAATAGDGNASIAFSPPASDGGSAITGYTVTCTPGPVSAAGTASPILVAGLSNGTPYSCTVTATNAAGTSPASSSASVTPAGSQSAPTYSLTESPASVDFGGQSMGTVSPEVSLSVVNNGTGAVTISGVTVSDPQFVVSNGCTTLPAGASCNVLVAFAPAVTVDPLNTQVAASATLAIASNAAGSPITVTLAGLGQKSLVSHYYEAILGRPADPAGSAYWAGEAARLAGLSINVNEAWYALAMSFLNSPEYRAQNRTDAQFVSDLYETFLNRPGDDGGIAYWTGQLAQGMSREVLIPTFMFSAEYITFTQNVFGNTASRPEVDLVVDWFRGLLSRLPDTDGFNYWLARLRTAQCTGSAAAVYAEADAMSSLFLGSAEYAARGRTPSQYVGDLYNSFMRRGGDLAGVQFWIDQVASGTMTREQVRTYFLASPEFANRVQAVVSAGCAP